MENLPEIQKSLDQLLDQQQTAFEKIHRILRHLELSAKHSAFLATTEGKVLALLFFKRELRRAVEVVQDWSDGSA